jgi:5-bromo-4-chloroindolyl phosphate hydrolysis protein
MLGYHHAEVSDNIIKYIDETLENEEQKHRIRDILNCQTSIESACNMLNTDYNINKYVYHENLGAFA